MVTASVCAAAGLQCGLTWMGLGGWRCPFFQCTGVPCPGCGLTRASLALLRGDVSGAFALHLFAPVLVVALMLLYAAVVLPEAARGWLLCKVESIERGTGLTGFLAISLICYWSLRLAFQGEAFVRLIKG